MQNIQDAQNGSRRPSSASQVRRSSRAASRRASTPKQFADLAYDDPNIDYTDPNFFNQFLENTDGFVDPQPDFGTFDWGNIGFDQYGNPPFDLNALPEQARASFSLLQNPLSALPATPRANAFNNAFMNTAAHAQASPKQSGHQFNDIPNVAEQKPKSPSRRKESNTRFEVPFSGAIRNDEFAGFGGIQQGFGFTDQIDPRVLGGHPGPYYPSAHYQQYHDTQNYGQDTYTPGVGPSKRHRSVSQDTHEDRDRSRKKARSSAVSSRSDSTYPDRSRSGSIGSSHRSQQVLKRKSVYNTDPFKYETPKADPEKPWIRTNGTTRGLTTRTAKCNNYNPQDYYEHGPHPLADGWSSGRNEFKYTHDGEWKERTMTASQIRDFILNYPEDQKNGIGLKLWIQVGPTDSSRRYLSESWAKCRFAECPAHKYQTGTILHGHYRVAFDERWFSDQLRRPKAQYDPHLAAGAYVHLYCMERFLDFPYICRKAHVEADIRQISTEPKQKFAATLAGRPESSLVEDFITYARSKQLYNLPEFKDGYPEHSQYRGGHAKPHKQTLVYAMHKAKEATRPESQKEQFRKRGAKPTHITVNKGDLEVLFEEVIRKKAINRKSRVEKRKVQEVDSDDDEQWDDEEYSKKRRRLIEEAKREDASARRKRTRRSSPRSARKVHQEPVYDDEDSSDDDAIFVPDEHASAPSRRSQRTANRKRPDYSEDGEVPQRSSRGRARDLPEDLEAYYQPASAYIPPAELPNNDLMSAADLANLQQATARRRSTLGAYVDPELEAVDLDALFAQEGLNRRVSSLPSFSRNNSILRLPGSRNSSFGKRHASFAMQPVSQQRTFDTEAPPHDVENADQADSPRWSLRSGRGSTLEKGQKVLGVKGVSHKVRKRLQS